tara:strand:- start:2246 stop:3598 length:1353 start_codon:yes stop_codon:yes gene_type:complete
MLARAAGGFGAIALNAILSENTESAKPAKPHHTPRAKRVIFLYLTGGVSHVDSFDYKPQLFADDEKTITVDNWQGLGGDFKRHLKKPDWTFRPGGNSGVMVSDLFPHMRSIVDDLCVIKSMESDHTNHYEGTLGMHTGSWTFARPSIGSWVSYGLGTENANLPSFMVLAPAAPYAGPQTWGNDFLPGTHQGTHIVPGPKPIENVAPRGNKGTLQTLEMKRLIARNKARLAERPGDSALEAQIQALETAFRMQYVAPEAFDIGQEAQHTLNLYGIDEDTNTGFGWQCLVGRRLAERGVRFIELIDTGSSGNWDSHGNMADHGRLAPNVDQPIAGLITDLKQRGMLDDTLVVWTTEFGRTPYQVDNNHPGREHHHQVFSSWMAGAGLKGGFTYGESDEHGIAVAEDRCHVHDFHATILHLLGLNHEELTYKHAGRDYRLTDVHGEVKTELFS